MVAVVSSGVALSMKYLVGLMSFVSCVGLGGASLPAHCADQPHAGSLTVTTQATLSQAEKWVKERSLPSFVLPATDKEDKKKAPVRSFMKGIAKGAAKELSASADGMAKDMVFVFSVQDTDPYDKSAPPKNRPAIVLQFTMIDGSTAYLHRFPDGSFAVDGGFADGTVIVPNQSGEFVIKYPNGLNGRVVFQGRNKILVYRPDKTITTFQKNLDGGYSINNDKIGYMGSAKPDSTGVKYEMGEW